MFVHSRIAVKSSKVKANKLKDQLDILPTIGINNTVTIKETIERKILKGHTAPNLFLLKAIET